MHHSDEHSYDHEGRASWKELQKSGPEIKQLLPRIGFFFKYPYLYLKVLHRGQTRNTCGLPCQHATPSTTEQAGCEGKVNTNCLKLRKNQVNILVNAIQTEQQVDLKYFKQDFKNVCYII